MQPLEMLLDRIAWDPNFGRGGSFALGYQDRLAGGEVIVPLASVKVDTTAGTISRTDDDGVVARVPLHRVRTVYKDGEIIWHRPEHRPATP